MFEFILTLIFFLVIMGLVGQVFAIASIALNFPILLLPENEIKYVIGVGLFILCGAGFIYSGFLIWPEIARVVHHVLPLLNGVAT